MNQLLVVGAGGFIGAIARFLLSDIAQKRFPTFPAAGTMVVNMLGCLAIGLIATLITQRPTVPDHVRLLVVTGFLGSLTTFSTFGHETVSLITGNQWRLAGANVLVSVTIGLMGVWLGRTIASAFTPPVG